MDPRVASLLEDLPPELINQVEDFVVFLSERQRRCAETPDQPKPSGVMTYHQIDGAKLKRLRAPRGMPNIPQAAVASAMTVEIAKRIEAGMVLGPMLGRRRSRSTDAPSISSAYLSAWEKGGTINGAYFDVLLVAMSNLLGRKVGRADIEKA